MDIPLLIPILEGRNAPRKRKAWGCGNLLKLGKPVAVAYLCGVGRPGLLVASVTLELNLLLGVSAKSCVEQRARQVTSKSTVIAW